MSTLSKSRPVRTRSPVCATAPLESVGKADPRRLNVAVEDRGGAQRNDATSSRSLWDERSEQPKLETSTPVRNAAGIVGVGLLLGLLASCATPWDSSKTNVQAAKDLALSGIDSPIAGGGIPGGQIRNHFQAFGGNETVERPHGAPLPVKASKFALNSFGVNLSLREIGQELSVQTGLPVDVQDDMPSVSAPAGGKAAAASTGPRQKADNKCVMAVKFNGETTTFLDSLETFCDLHYSYEHGRLSIEQYQIKTYELYASPETVVVNSTIKSVGIEPTGNSGTNGSTSANGQSSSGQSLDNSAHVDSTINPWDEIQTTLQGMVGDGRVDVAKGSRKIVVIAKHKAQLNVAKLIADINKAMRREVVMDIVMLEITTSADLDVGSSLTAALNQVAGQYAINMSSPPIQAFSNAAVAGFTVQNGANGKTNSWNGSGAVINALQSFGNVSLKRRIRASTTNGQALPVTIARQLGYIASTSIAQGNSTSSSLSSQTQGTLNLGLVLMLTPVIHDDGAIALEYAFGLSSLNALTQEGSASTGYVQTPDVNVRSSLQHAMVMSGESVVLLGYDEAGDNLTETGLPGIAGGVAGIFGGSKVGSNSGAQLVIIMTPTIVRKEATVR